MSFAKIAVLGNLGADPDTRYTPSGAMVVSLSIAVNPRRRGNQQGQGNEAPPTWYRISAWDRLAERIDRLAQQGYIAKGRTLYVEGTFEPREFTGNDGNTRISYDITLTDFQFVGGSDRQDGQQGNASGGSYGGGNRGGYQNQNQGGDAGYSDGNSNRRSAFNDDDQSSMDDVPF